MLIKIASVVLMCAALAGMESTRSATADGEIRAFIARWNAAYTGLDAAALAALETPDYEMVDRFGHWI
jgi:ketosteroid isomerase-like protein